MKNLMKYILPVLFLVIAPMTQAATSTFEDLTLAPDSYWNGDDDGSGYGTFSGFISGDTYFTNYQAAAYSSWEAFAYSNMTDITTPGMTNQYSAITGGGVDGSSNYAVAFTMTMWGQYAQTYNGYASGEYAQTVDGFYVTNTTYAYLSMLNGDSFAKAFDEDDWFLLTVYGLDSSYEKTGSSVEFYLAEGTDILSTWEWVDLTGLGAVYGLEFELTSSDSGAYGMNTPAYFAMDNLVTNPVPIPGAIWLMGSGILCLFGIRKKNRLK